MPRDVEVSTSLMPRCDTDMLFVTPSFITLVFVLLSLKNAFLYSRTYLDFSFQNQHTDGNSYKRKWVVV